MDMEDHPWGALARLIGINDTVGHSEVLWYFDRYLEAAG
jgi:hypothetical protein